VKKYAPVGGASEEGAAWKIRSTEDELIEFMESNVFQDYLTMLDNQDNFLSQMLLDPDQTRSGREYDKIRGGRQNIADLREVFQMMLDDVRYENGLKKEEE